MGGHDAAAGQRVMELVMAPWISQAVGTLARLRVFDVLAAGPASAASVAERVGASADAIARVMRAAAAVGVLERGERGYALTAVGQILRSDVPGSMRALIDVETAPGHWLPWGRLDACVRTGRSQASAALGTDVWSYYGAHPEEGRAFSEGMSGLSAMSIGAVDAAYELPRATRVVDVGGAHGAFLAYALGKLPEARGVLLDLPHVVATAGPALEAAGIAARVETSGGDFFEAVPEGGDLYLLKHIVHDWPDDAARRILTSVRRAMAPGAKVVCVEMLIPEDGSPSPAMFLDLNMLVMLDGRERTATELRALFASAGLEVARVVPTPSPFAVIEATAR